MPDVFVSFNSDRAFHASGRTDGQGRYRVLGLEPGRYRVQVSSGIDVFLAEERTITSPRTFDVEVGDPLP